MKEGQNAKKTTYSLILSLVAMPTNRREKSPNPDGLEPYSLTSKG